MSNLSYYDEINNFIKNSNDEEEDDTYIKNMLSIFNLTPSQCNLVKNIRQEKHSPQYLLQKLKEDMPKLEKFIIDKEYRKKLICSFYPSKEYNEFFNIHGLEKKVKEKIGIPENATIKYEKVKCSRKCIHDHQYFYAYYWNPTTKKLRKKYIGKELPEPFTFKIHNL